MASGLYSHPGVLLEDHTNRVLSLARCQLTEVILPWWRESPRRDLLELAIALHDFGKATEFFQAVLRGERRKDAYSRHGNLSALFFLHRALAWLPSAEIDIQWEALLFAYLAIRRHHTNLRDLADELLPPDDRDLEILTEQIRSISPEKANAFLRALDVSAELRGALVFTLETFLEWQGEEASRLLRAWRRKWRQLKKTRTDTALLFRFLNAFSALLDADRLEAGAEGHLPPRVAIPTDVVDCYKRQAFSKAPVTVKGLNELREQAYREVLAQPLSPKEHLYTLTLPTGMGKTLTGMAVALKLREIIYKATSQAPRIIYALPFLSIIDQNAVTMEKVLTTGLDKVDSRALVKHHHLADLRYREQMEDEVRELDYAASRLLTEGWHAEIVVTTFVQLFDTLLAWRNDAARRMNKLHHAILLLDEVQALPAVYWPLVRNLLTEAAAQLEAYVILMTATQPYLLEDARELVPDPKRYFRALDRLDVFVDLTSQSLEDFTAKFKPKAGKSYLFMANTIASAQQLHSLLQQKLDEKVVFLSTGVTPKERVERIEALRQGRYRFAVSTQLIEAGVDVDFDVIYRDLAPLDSLVQAAGRCNRHLTPGKRGALHIVQWVDDKACPFSRRIYDLVLLARTEKRLQEQTHLREPDFLALLSEYFRDVWITGIPDKVADELWEAVCTLRFDGKKDKPCVLRSQDAAGAFLSQFCLTEVQPYKREVFVQVNDEAVAVWQEAKTILYNLRRDKDLWAARERFARLKPWFFQYVVSVALKPDQAPHWDDDLHIYVVDHEVLDTYYDRITGFRREIGGTAFWA